MSGQRDVFKTERERELFKGGVLLASLGWSLVWIVVLVLHKLLGWWV